MSEKNISDAIETIRQQVGLYRDYFRLCPLPQSLEAANIVIDELKRRNKELDELKRRNKELRIALSKCNPYEIQAYIDLEAKCYCCGVDFERNRHGLSCEYKRLINEGDET